ncbi:hypothetical protein BJI47_01450 [Rhodococcus sp. 1168]|nr:hypothetical protein BJI47_01450 [Rhodococcus sp. 1168]
MWDDHVDGEAPADRTVRLDAARRICRSCPVRLACDVEAQISPYTEGIWAGFHYLDATTDEEETVTASQPLPF